MSVLTDEEDKSSGACYDKNSKVTKKALLATNNSNNNNSVVNWESPLNQLFPHTSWEPKLLWIMVIYEHKVDKLVTAFISLLLDNEMAHWYKQK